jgi:antitoxin component YwqK of YwqJK toxin-antitoxin module
MIQKKNPKDILPKDKNGELHGYCEKYHENGELWYKGVYIRGMAYGYIATYNRDGSVDDYFTGYYPDGVLARDFISKNNPEGYCYTWNREIL